MNRFSFEAPAVLFAAGVLGLLVHLEVRASAQAADLKSLHAEIGALSANVAQLATAAPPQPMAPPVARFVADADAMQAIARAAAQLVQDRGSSAGSGARAADADAPPSRSLEQEKALAQASEIAARTIAQGRLSRDDVLAMRRDLQDGSATDAERDALRSQIAVAINAQKLIPDDLHVVYP